MVQQLINDLLQYDDLETQLVNRTKVIDHLLDIRSLSKANPDLLGRIDRVLSEVPGVTVVSLIWWRTTLAELDQIARLDILV